MVGLDFDDEKDIHPCIEMATHISDSHLEKINESLSKVLSRTESKRIKSLVGAGAGRFMVRKLALMNNLKYIDFTDLLSYPEEEEHKVLSCAAAVSVAQIARAVS